MSNTNKDRLQRCEHYRGRTTPEVEWHVWNKEHTCYMVFGRKRDAVAYLNIKETSDDQ